MHCLCDFDILIWLILVGVISCRIRCVDFWFKVCWIGECFLFVRLREQSFSFFEGECVRVVSQTVLFLSLFLFLFLLLLLVRCDSFVTCNYRVPILCRRAE